jgi:lipid II:glycine glycyltransferase (peptidoglycan interpeptide bridge formation enzyme)
MTSHDSHPNWDKQLAARQGSILQSHIWGAFQRSLGYEPVWLEAEGWQALAALHQSKGLRYLLCSYGPVADSEPAMRQAMTALGEEGVRRNVDFVRVEPQFQITAVDLEAMGARRIKDWQPQHTQVIDLTGSEQQLRSDLASGHRNLINGTERRGITIRQSGSGKDFEEFLLMLEDTAKRAGTNFHSRNYFQKLWQTLAKDNVIKLYVAEVAGRPVASALFYDWGHTRYYAHAGAWQQANREAKASVSLLWQAILDAKADGQKHFDLWGVSPVDQPKHSLAGVSKFKRGFGGHHVTYMGTWDLPLKTAKYRAYSLYRKLVGLT